MNGNGSSTGQLAAALVKAQKSMGKALKDSSNPFFKSKYADLTSVWDACRDALTDNGLSVVQVTDQTDGSVVSLRTMLLHDSGEKIEGVLVMKPKDDSPQGIGSAITYARRYALAAMVGVCPEDDDAEAAQGRRDHGEQPKPAAKGRKGKSDEHQATNHPDGHTVPEAWAEFVAACKDKAKTDLDDVVELKSADFTRIGQTIKVLAGSEVNAADSNERIRQAAAWLMAHGVLKPLSDKEGVVFGATVERRQTAAA
jgi:hypothetical protein